MSDMREINPLLRSEFLRNMDVLGVSPECTRAELWVAAQNFSIFWCQYCIERGLPVEAVTSVFGVHRKCENHFEAALFGAKNLVECYLAPEFDQGDVA